ncbi:MAG: UDP-N-acetylmuramate dehydrogenase [Acidobacteriota bacterium]
MTRREMQDLAVRLGQEHGAGVELDAALAPRLSMRVGGRAAAIIEPRGAEEVASLVEALRAVSAPHHLLGGGSNVLADDGDLDFLVVQVPADASSVSIDDVLLRVGAGVKLAVVLREAAKAGLSGLEWAAGLPGTIGGAVFGNAGAFGGEIGPSVREVALLDAQGVLRRHRPEPNDFAYRHSFVREGELVLEVELELERSTPEAVRDEMNRVNTQRSASQPKGGHSSGCVFKNPEGGQAGRLIDECGLKGRRAGGVHVSEAHGNFFINDGDATAADIHALITTVRDEVRRQRGIELECELRHWGPRDDGEGGTS